MHKLWTLFCLGLVFALVSSQTCSDTISLRAFYNFTGLASAAVQPNVQYCNSIKSGPVCCTATDMNSFQAKSDAIIATLTTQAAARDTSFSNIGGSNPAAVQEQLVAQVATLNTAITTKGGSFAQLVKQANSTGNLSPVYAGFGSFSTNVNPINSASPSNPQGVPNSNNNNNNNNPPTNNNSSRLLQSVNNNSASTSVNVYGVLNNLQAIQAQLGNASAAVTSSVSDFQAARSTCVIAAYNVQAASWCLSCDPNATLKGYDNTRNQFTMGSDVCNRLKTACYPYLVASGLQNSAFNQKMLLDTLTFATNSLNNGGNPVGQTFTYPGQQPASMPTNCTSADNCNWICTNLFNNGQVNTASLINGGVVASTSSRLLSEGLVGPSVELSTMRPRQLAERELSSGTFNPAANEAGVTVQFAADPAGIASSSNGKSGMLTYGSVLGGMIAMIWSMMM